MTRSKHDAHFTALHVAAEAKRADHANLDFADVPIVQPTNRGHVPPRPLPPSVNKYHNVRTAGYASAKEAKRAAELKLLEQAGAIRDLKEQVPFLLIPAQGDERACWYVADWTYEEEPREPQQEGWQFVCEDCKGFRTPTYIIKRKLMLMVHKIKIRET